MSTVFLEGSLPRDAKIAGGSEAVWPLGKLCVPNSRSVVSTPNSFKRCSVHLTILTTSCLFSKEVETEGIATASASVLMNFLLLSSTYLT